MLQEKLKGHASGDLRLGEVIRKGFRQSVFPRGEGARMNFCNGKVRASENALPHTSNKWQTQSKSTCSELWKLTKGLRHSEEHAFKNEQLPVGKKSRLGGVLNSHPVCPSSVGAWKTIFSFTPNLLQISLDAQLPFNNNSDHSNKSLFQPLVDMMPCVHPLHRAWDDKARALGLVNSTDTPTSQWNGHYFLQRNS